MIMVTNKQTER